MTSFPFPSDQIFYTSVFPPVAEFPYHQLLLLLRSIPPVRTPAWTLLQHGLASSEGAGRHVSSGLQTVLLFTGARTPAFSHQQDFVESWPSCNSYELPDPFLKSCYWASHSPALLFRWLFPIIFYSISTKMRNFPFVPTELDTDFFIHFFQFIWLKTDQKISSRASCTKSREPGWDRTCCFSKWHAVLH